MTPLLQRLVARIRADGPITMADHMAACLTDPEHGYYLTRDPLGLDFVTAPEVSQMFGEMIGLWLAAVWSGLGRPDPVRLVEIGPGRGTLMADALRAARAMPGFAAAVDLWLIEPSAPLRAEQARRLPGARWAQGLGQVPPGPLLLVANELLDALPVRQFLGTPEGWREVLVGLGDGGLRRGLSDPLGPAPEGAWAEHSPQAAALLAEIGARIAGTGAALLVDYGYRAATRPPGPTLQALRRHAPADPLAAPGEADLTWLIDFDWAAAALSGPGRVTQVTDQAAFLAAMGIGARAAALARARPEAAESLADALDRLTAPGQMGTLFQVLAATPPGLDPPGFAA